MREKILSIIIPSYNMEAYLPKCCDSLLIDDKELFRKIDVIVVNDGSKDRTSEIAHGYEARFPDVFRVIDKRNGHYGSCINAGIAVAKGLFVKILDADDFYAKEGLSSLIKCLAESETRGEHIDAILSDFATVDAEGSVIQNITFPFDESTLHGFSEILRLDQRLEMHALTYRTENLRRIGYSQTEGICYTDVLWCFEPVVIIEKFRYLPKVVYMYLKGRDGQSTNKGVLVKNYSMYERLLSEMVVRYAKQAAVMEDVRRKYLLLSIKEIMSIMAYRAFYVLPSSSVCRAIQFLSDMVQKLPTIRNVVNHRSFSRRIKWKFVYALLKHKYIGYVFAFGGRIFKIR